MVLNTLIDETDIVNTFQSDIKCPSETHKSCDLEYLRTERLRQTHPLFIQLQIEHFKSLLQVRHLFVVTECDAKWIEHHGQHVEFHFTRHSHIKREPNDYEAVDPDPEQRHEERNRVKVLATATLATHWVRYAEPLQVRQRNQQDVADLSLEAKGPGDFVLSLVKPFHDELVNVRWGQLLGWVVHNILLVDLFVAFIYTFILWIILLRYKHFKCGVCFINLVLVGAFSDRQLTFIGNIILRLAMIFKAIFTGIYLIDRLD